LTATSIVPRPLLLSLIMIVASYCALGFFTAALALERANHGYMIIGQHVASEQFLTRARALVACLSILALYMGAIVFALHRRFSSSRPLLLAYFPISCLVTVVMFLQVLESPRPKDFVGLIIFTILGTLAAHWYLYRKPGVVAYYQAIKGRDSAPAP
jgi:hypothetical protein